MGFKDEDSSSLLQRAFLNRMTIVMIILIASVLIGRNMSTQHDSDFNDNTPNKEYLGDSPRRALLGKHHHKSPRVIAANLERKYTAWLSEYKASTPDPDQQEMCYNIVAGLANSSFGEHQQDMFVYHNFYKYWPMNHMRGFYVDIGSEDALTNSKSAFFDVCLGWDGICIEPDSKHHDKIRSSRTCKLLPYCISDKPSNTNSAEASTEAGTSSAATSTSTSSWLGFLGFNKKQEEYLEDEPVQCYALDDLITRHAMFKKRRTIDLLLMDIGGKDLAVIKSANLTGITINTVIMEDSKFDTRVLDRVLGEKGFVKFHQLPYESVYMPRKAKMWFPWNYEKQWEDVDLERARAIEETKRRGKRFWIRGNGNKNAGN
jgi:FkbM family methyltransferase